MAGLDPAIHFLLAGAIEERRGWPRQARPWRFGGLEGRRPVYASPSGRGRRAKRGGWGPATSGWTEAFTSGLD